MQKIIILSTETEIVIHRVHLSSMYGEERWSSQRNTCQKMCSTDLWVFSLSGQVISPKNRYKGQRNVWVEVSTGKRKKVKVPSEILTGSTPNSRINRSVVTFQDYFYPESIGKRTNSPADALVLVYMTRFGEVRALGMSSVRRGRGLPCTSEQLNSFEFCSYLYVLQKQ